MIIAIHLITSKMKTNRNDMRLGDQQIILIKWIEISMKWS
jgi:hypothetical protein